MSNRSLFQPAAAQQAGLKVLLWGSYGTGKTCAALSFPGPLAVIDLEGGTALYDGFDVVRTKDLRRVEAAIGELEAKPTAYRTVIVDPLTVLWQLLQDAGQGLVDRRGNRGDGLQSGQTLSTREWGLIKRRYASILTRLNNLPMNVVLISRQADLYEGKGDQLTKVGIKPDVEKGTPYVADLVLRCETVEDEHAEQFIAIVEKVRGPVLSAALPKGKRLSNYTADPAHGLYPRHLAKLLTGQPGGTGRGLESDAAVVAGNALLLEDEGFTPSARATAPQSLAAGQSTPQAADPPQRHASAPPEALEPEGDPVRIAAATKRISAVLRQRKPGSTPTWGDISLEFASLIAPDVTAKRATVAQWEALAVALEAESPTEPEAAA